MQKERALGHRPLHLFVAVIISHSPKPSPHTPWQYANNVPGLPLYAALWRDEWEQLFCCWRCSDQIPWACGEKWLIIVQSHKERHVCHLANVAAIWTPFCTIGHFFLCFVLLAIKMTNRLLKTLKKFKETPKLSVDVCYVIPSLNDMKWPHNCWARLVCRFKGTKCKIVPPSVKMLDFFCEFIRGLAHKGIS